MSLSKCLGYSLFVLASANVFADRGSRHQPTLVGAEAKHVVDGIGQHGTQVDGYVALACHQVQDDYSAKSRPDMA